MKAHKNNNKGFTLIELIIVIAIIATLSAVLAPQFLKYVDRARESSDLQAASIIIDALTFASIDPTLNIPRNGFIELIWVTGTESGGSVTRGSLIIRNNTSKDRVSVFNDKVGDDDIAAVVLTPDQLQQYADSVYASINGGKATHLDKISTWYQTEFTFAESKLAQVANLGLHINLGTGEVALAKGKWAGASGETNKWIELGLNAIPAP